MTHRHLADKLDKSIGIFSLYESGQRFPPKTTFESILEELKPKHRPHLKRLWKAAQTEWKQLSAKAEEGDAINPASPEPVSLLLSPDVIQIIDNAKERILNETTQRRYVNITRERIVTLIVYKYLDGWLKNELKPVRDEKGVYGRPHVAEEETGDGDPGDA